MCIFAHPVMDSVWVALPEPTCKAKEVLRRVYNRTARLAAGMDDAESGQRTQNSTNPHPEISVPKGDA